nr:hypothetical protein [Tanacetum cinerariifolium]
MLLEGRHNIHKRPHSPLHITVDDYSLGNLKFVPKGGLDEDDTSANVVRDTSSPADAKTGDDTENSNSEGDIKILNVDEERGENISNTVTLEERIVELDEGQAGSDSGNTLDSRPPPDEDHARSNPGQSHVALTGPNLESMHKDLIVTVYPKVYKNLEHIIEENVFLENPPSSSGTLLSMKNLDDAFTFRNSSLKLQPSLVRDAMKTKILLHPSKRLIKNKTIPGWLKPVPEEERSKTPELNWAVPLNELPETENIWANEIANAYKDPDENKLIQKTEDMGSFIKWKSNRSGNNSTTILLQYGSGISCIMSQDRRNALSISKINAAYYPDFRRKELVPSLWIESKREYDFSAAYDYCFIGYPFDYHVTLGFRSIAGGLDHVNHVIRLPIERRISRVLRKVDYFNPSVGTNPVTTMMGRYQEYLLFSKQRLPYVFNDGYKFAFVLIREFRRYDHTEKEGFFLEYIFQIIKKGFKFKICKSPNSKIEYFLFNSNNCISSVKKRLSQDEGNFDVFFYFENNKINRKDRKGCQWCWVDSYLDGNHYVRLNANYRDSNLSRGHNFVSVGIAFTFIGESNSFLKR